MNRLRLTASVLAAALVAVSATPASAAVCSVSSAGVAFGSYDTLASSPVDGVGDISISCDVSVSFSVALSEGTGSFEQRQMTAGASQLSYNLYTDASRTIVWGNGISGSTVSRTGDAVTIPVYARISARQNVPAGVYGDTITITVSY